MESEVEPITTERQCPLDRLHPSLHATFVSLPGGSNLLTPEQLDAVFGGDRRALRDIANLIFKIDENDHNKVG